MIFDCLVYAVMDAGQTEQHTWPHVTYGLGSKQINARIVLRSTKKNHLHEKMTVNLRPTVCGVIQAKSRESDVSETGNSACKGPEVGKKLGFCWKK